MAIVGCDSDSVIFEYDSRNNWNPIHRLVTSDGTNTGGSVAINDNFAAVGTTSSNL